MESQKKSLAKVIITSEAKNYFFDILEYLYEHYTLDRAEEIANDLHQKTLSLCSLFSIGTSEFRLKHLGKNHQFILFKRLRNKDVKIIYFYDKKNHIVYVTDFFSTEMDDTKIHKRND